jgi:hypothetical protein
VGPGSASAPAATPSKTSSSTSSPATAASTGCSPNPRPVSRSSSPRAPASAPCASATTSASATAAQTGSSPTSPSSTTPWPASCTTPPSSPPPPASTAALRDATKQAAHVEVSGCDFRSGGALIQQTVNGRYRIKNNRGLTDYADAAVPVIADTFSGADSASVVGRLAVNGTTSTAWEVVGTSATIGTVSGRLKPLSGAAATAAVTTSVTTGRVRMSVPVMKGSGSRRGALVARFIDANNYVRADPNGGVWALTKVVGGTATALGVADSVTVANGDVVEVAYTPTALTLVVNGRTVGTATDSTHNTAVKVGLQGAFTTDSITTLDDFEWYSS